MICDIHHVAILIPARNEEALLPRCIRSVQRAGALLPPEFSFDIVVAVDSSTDETYTVAKSLLDQTGSVVVTSAGCVGIARSLAAATALERYAKDPRGCWLANTDADCEVPETWLLDQVELAVMGAEAIAGTVEVDDFSEHQSGVEDRFRETYILHADGTHPHVHGANIGMRADVYLRAGGWAARPTAEDHDLWKRLTSFGCHKQSVSRLRVLTS